MSWGARDKIHKESPARKILVYVLGTEFDVVLCLLFGTSPGSGASIACYHAKNSHRLVISAFLVTSSSASMQE